ncbi:hypothetical protein AB0C96_09800 [Streptomyces sp. NPDC048506]|uniref:hypothetical protein n=1 Tax=Streptomyces sp. NPDC048506 TaxID=3155028 RepID=UPI003433EAD8
MRYTAPLSRAQAVQLGEEVGMIVAFAANALHHMHGVNIERLMQSFTSSAALDVTAARYLTALDEGHRPGEAAGRAGTALIHDWADAVLEARSRQQSATPSAPARESAK